jgi:hypothetical protein
MISNAEIHVFGEGAMTREVRRGSEEGKDRGIEEKGDGNIVGRR